MNRLSKEDIEEIAIKLHELFSVGIDPEAHAKHHRFIDSYMAELERKKKLRERIKANVFGWLAITVIGGIGLLAWKYIVPGIIKSAVGGA